MPRDLSRLIEPRSIAFVGGEECALAIRRTLELGFEGKVHAIHPARAELGGIPALASADLLEGPVDAAFIAVRREPAIDVVRTLSAKGCGGAVVYAAGFAEAGAPHLEQELLAAAGGMPLMGPNCYGFVNSLARVALWPDEHGIGRLDRGVAIVSQSGNMACNFAMCRRALPLAAVYTVGNMADIGMADLLSALARDPRITAIGLHIEGMADMPAFARAASEARARRKPVVALKTGVSEQGARAALSHTSSLAGSDDLYSALFRRCGIARLHSVTSFVETLKLLHHGGPLQGDGLLSLSCSGGEAALVADMAAGRSIRFPPFDPVTRAEVAATLGELVTVDNPLDYHTFIWRQEEKLEQAFTAALSGCFDAAMLILDTPTQPHMNPDAWLTTARAYRRAASSTGARAAVVASLPECMPLDLADELARDGVAPMLGLDDALSAFEAAAQIGRSWEEGGSPADLPEPTSRGCGERMLSEYEAKALLRRFGLAVPQGELVPSAQAAEAARRIGFPVTLKISAPDMAHKTEAGGVVLNLRTPEEVERAAERLKRIAPELLVERMIEGAVAELIVGLKADPQFGLALVIGAGGILTELLEDTATLLLPCEGREIETALRGLKVWRLIEGYRGRSGDGPAVFEAIEAIVRFAAAHEGFIEELDVNPLLVLPGGAVAVDALLRMRTP